jgi:hypothetical protein
MDNRTNHTETKLESTVNSEDKSDNSNESGPDVALNSSSEQTSPETCRAGIDE